MKHVRIQLCERAVINWVITDYSGLSLDTSNKYHKRVDGEEFAELWDDPYILRDYELGTPIFDEALLFALKIVHNSKGNADYRLINGLGC